MVNMSPCRLVAGREELPRHGTAAPALMPRPNVEKRSKAFDETCTQQCPQVAILRNLCPVASGKSCQVIVPPLDWSSDISENKKNLKKSLQWEARWSLESIFL